MNPEQLQLKTATKRLVSSLGGIEAAASIIGKGKSTVGRWTNKHDAEFINLADLHELEENSAEPVVTACLARLAGGVFIPLPMMPGSSDALPMQIMDLLQQAGELSAQIREGLGDGEFSSDDAENALTELHDVERCVAALRLALTAAAENTGSVLKAVANG